MFRFASRFAVCHSDVHLAEGVLRNAAGHQKPVHPNDPESEPARIDRGMQTLDHSRSKEDLSRARAKGRELFFRTGRGQTILVAGYSVEGDSFVPGVPRVWTNHPLLEVPYLNYDVAPDGKRIIALAPAKAPESQPPKSHVVLLLNFFDELRRRAPVNK